MGVAPPDQQNLEWWLERFAIEGFNWYGGMQRENPDDFWPEWREPSMNGDDLAELAELGVTVRRS